MIRKILFLASAASVLTAVPALAQDAAGQTPPAQTPAGQAAAPAQGTLQLQPGASVRGSDGSVIGTLEGVRDNDAGEQELTVRGSDGQLRGVPLGGLTQQGADVVVGWSATEYNAAPAISGAPPAPSTPPASTTPAAPAPGATANPAPTPPTDPSTSAAPEPGEAAEPSDPQS